jgi:hypothetical protein
MATNKTKRSNPLAQPSRRSPHAQSNDHQRKAEFLETLHHINRGYGIALSALERLEIKDRQFRPASRSKEKA